MSYKCMNQQPNIIECIRLLECFAENSEKNSSEIAQNWLTTLTSTKHIASQDIQLLYEDAKILDAYFTAVQTDMNIEETILHSFFGSLIEQSDEFSSVNFASVCHIYIPFFKQYSQDFNTCLYTALYYSLLQVEKVDLYEVQDELLLITSYKQFLESLQNATISDGLKWRIIDFVYHFDTYQIQIDATLKKIERAYLLHLPIIQPLLQVATDELNTFFAQASEEDIVNALHIDIAKKEVTQINCSLSFFNAVSYIDIQYNNDTFLSIGIFYQRIIKLTKHILSESDRSIILKHLGEPSKFEIIMSCLENPCNGKELASRLQLTQATISHHVKQLIKSGILFMHVEQKQIQYCVNKTFIQEHLMALQNYFK